MNVSISIQINNVDPLNIAKEGATEIQKAYCQGLLMGLANGWEPRFEIKLFEATSGRLVSRATHETHGPIFLTYTLEDVSEEVDTDY